MNTTAPVVHLLASTPPTNEGALFYVQLGAALLVPLLLHFMERCYAARRLEACITVLAPA